MLIVLLVGEILSRSGHATLNFVHQVVFNLPCGRLLEVFEILCLDLIRHLLLLEVLLAELAHVQLFQLPPALDAQTAHILESFYVHLDNGVETLEETAIALLNFVPKSLKDQRQPREGNVHACNRRVGVPFLLVIGQVAWQVLQIVIHRVPEKSTILTSQTILCQCVQPQLKWLQVF